MTLDSLAERGKVLEEIFFADREQERIAALRAQAETDHAAAALGKATHIKDEALLGKLASLGLTVETLAAFSIVPMLSVAWVDRMLDNGERDAILLEVVAMGIEEGSPTHDLLGSWLTTTPQPELLDAWRAFYVSLKPHLTDDERQSMHGDLLAKAKRVARASGGFIGLGVVSSDERGAIEKLERLLA
jgi:hypothetical protein